MFGSMVAKHNRPAAIATPTEFAPSDDTHDVLDFVSVPAAPAAPAALPQPAAVAIDNDTAAPTTLAPMQASSQASTPTARNRPRTQWWRQQWDDKADADDEDECASSPSLGEAEPNPIEEPEDLGVHEMPPSPSDFRSRIDSSLVD